jgi:hypothetical protein
VCVCVCVCLAKSLLIVRDKRWQVGETNNRNNKKAARSLRRRGQCAPALEPIHVIGFFLLLLTPPPSITATAAALNVAVLFSFFFATALLTSS